MDLTYTKLCRDREILIELLKEAAYRDEESKVDFLSIYIRHIENKLLDLQFGEGETQSEYMDYEDLCDYEPIDCM